MKRRRRIFRGPSLGRPASLRTAAAVLLGLCVTGGLLTTSLSTDLFGRPPSPPALLAAEAGNIAIIDGDTLRLAGQVVRLRGVEAPNRGDRCLGGLDCGGAAAEALAGLVRGRHVECALSGADDAGRPLGACQANGTDLARAIVASGWARAQGNAPELSDLELHARRQRSGLWADAAAR